jgi:3-phenylpropionate/trans-cinnamate dioxygenase ferredoxin reductase subunit
VTLIEHAATPLQHVLGERIGTFFAELHRSRGVDLLTGARVEMIEDGRKIMLGTGDVVEADAIVLGVGVAPATALAQAAGLRIDNGVLTDEHLRTSVSDVFAAGDVANAYHPRYQRHVRVEHWANAADQGAAAARSMLGVGAAYAKVPFFFSDQYDLGLEYFGLHGPGDRLVFRGDADVASFQAFWVADDGMVMAGMHANDWDASGAIERMVERGARVDTRELASLDVSLDELAPDHPKVA